MRFGDDDKLLIIRSLLFPLGLLGLLVSQAPINRKKIECDDLVLKQLIPKRP